MKIGFAQISSRGSARAQGLFLVCAMFILLAVAFNQWMQPGSTAGDRSSCIANLDRIKRAKAAWALENMKISTDIPEVSDLFGEDRFYKEAPVCPQGGYYTVGRVEALPKCSFAEHNL